MNKSAKDKFVFCHASFKLTRRASS